MEQIGLYQIHWPGFITNGIGFVNDNFVQGLADCKNQGLVQASLQNLQNPDLRASGYPVQSTVGTYWFLFKCIA